MNNFNFYVLGNYSPNIRMFGKKKCTCYRLMGFNKEILLDFGIGVYHKFIRMVKEEKIDLNNLIIIISHNHVDHSFSLFPLIRYLRKLNKKSNELVKVTVFMPKRSIVYDFVSKAQDVIDLRIIDEQTEFEVGKAKFSFCNTIHKGESYATKITYKGNTFVYTSDIARYSRTLKEFVRGANTVLLDAGYPQKLLHTFKNYHGNTKDILRETEKLGVRKILASHIRFFSKSEDYLNSFPTNAECCLVKQDYYYRMFK